MIVLPSFAWPLESYRKVYPMIQVIGSPLFRFLSTDFNFFLEYTLRAVTKNQSSPFPTWRSKPIADPILTEHYGATRMICTRVSRRATTTLLTWSSD